MIFQRADYLIPQYSAYIQFLFLTGCRPGEVIALKWDDLNFKTRRVRIDESWDGTTFKLPKTGKTRSFYMSDPVS